LPMVAINWPHKNPPMPITAVSACAAVPKSSQRSRQRAMHAFPNPPGEILPPLGPRCQKPFETLRPLTLLLCSFRACLSRMLAFKSNPTIANLSAGDSTGACKALILTKTSFT
jgi:hypothetical protein